VLILRGGLRVPAQSASGVARRLRISGARERQIESAAVASLRAKAVEGACGGTALFALGLPVLDLFQSFPSSLAQADQLSSDGQTGYAAQSAAGKATVVPPDKATAEPRINGVSPITHSPDLGGLTIQNATIGTLEHARFSDAVLIFGSLALLAALAVIAAANRRSADRRLTGAYRAYLTSDTTAALHKALALLDATAAEAPEPTEEAATRLPPASRKGAATSERTGPPASPSVAASRRQRRRRRRRRARTGRRR
jgi:hypothetical protein